MCDFVREVCKHATKWINQNASRACHFDNKDKEL
jgi:hypothetical protein